MKVNYPQTIIRKSTGTTEAEKYLNLLCNRTFLSLWSYPNVFRDQGRTNSKRSEAKGDGKEVCDLLVIFDNHVIIFSDKYCIFPNSGNIHLDWSRWYKRAVKDSAKQLYGAERWIFQYPENLYIDKDCKQQFPFPIPQKEAAIVHRIIVAHGASKECIRRLGGTGSLMIAPHIIGDMHIDANCLPFTIGQVDPLKGYIHVFDDTTLNIIMQTIDTIPDFIQYLSKKEEFISSGKLSMASGDDDLLAYYLQKTDKQLEHTFIEESEDDFSGMVIDEGYWESFSNHPSRLAQLKANDISYLWDKLIEKFIYHVTTGTSYRMSHPDLSSQEKLFRFLSKENRTRRRFLAQALHELLAKTGENVRATRFLLPTSDNVPCYLFLLLPKPKDVPYEEYRDVRGDLLLRYIKISKLQYPDAQDIIGIATETGFDKNRSEDCIYFDAREWSQEDRDEAEKDLKQLKELGMYGERAMLKGSIKEYPDYQKTPVYKMKGKDRNNPCPCGSGKKFKRCCGS